MLAGAVVRREGRQLDGLGKTAYFPLLSSRDSATLYESDAPHSFRTGVVSVGRDR